MVTVCWSVKGGVGVSVVSAALALSVRDETEDATLLVDLSGDIAHVLGQPRGVRRPGVGDWLASDVPEASLGGLVEELSPRLSLLDRGAPGAALQPERAPELVAWLEAWPGSVVVDLGSAVNVRLPLLQSASRSLLVLRLCYLGVRAACEQPRPDGVIVVEEPGRALRSADVASALGIAVVARIPFDPTISRAVDAGLLASRMPRLLRRGLRPVVADTLEASR